MSAEEIRHAAWLMVCETDAHEEVSRACARAAGWESSPRTWASIVSQWLSPDLRRPLPAWAAALVVRVTVPLGARDRISPLFAREGFDAAAAAHRPQRPPLAKVRRGSRRREGAA